MKHKIDQTRTYDDAGFRRRAACLCFKSDCESEVLLVGSSRHRDSWVVPGGGLEPGEEPEATAVREVNEEAGVVGTVDRLIGVFENTERKTRTFVYVLFVESLLDEYADAGRLRKWFAVENATQQLSSHKPVQQEYFDKLCQDMVHQRKVSLCCRSSDDVSTIACDAKSIVKKCSKCCEAYQIALQSSFGDVSPAENKLSLNSSHSNGDVTESERDVRLYMEKTKSNLTT